MFTIAIVGRKNVGKTSLFNKLIDKNFLNLSGNFNSTIDCNYGILYFYEKLSIIIDTCSLSNFNFINNKEKLVINSNIINIIQHKFIYICKNVDLIFLLVDCSVGLVFDDIVLYNYFLKNKKKIYIVVNKIDLVKYDINLYLSTFYSLGVKILHPVSINNILSILKFLKFVFYKNFNFFDEKKIFFYRKIINSCINLEKYIIYVNNFFKKKMINLNFYNFDLIKIAILGKPNVGKSTLLNSILGEKKNIISKIPGTTRDFLYSFFYNKNNNYIILDTPGIDKNYKYTKIYFNKLFTFKIIIYIIDINIGLSKYDLLNLNLILDSGKILLLVFNKCDYYPKLNKNLYIKYLHIKYNFMKNINLYFMSAIDLNSRKINIFLNILYNNYYKYLKIKISSSNLTKILKKAINLYFFKRNYEFNIFSLKYAHFGGYYPFTIVIHGKKINKINLSYKNYLVNFYFKILDIKGINIILKFKEI